MNPNLLSFAVCLACLVAAVRFLYGPAASQYLAAVFGAAGAVLLGIPSVHPIWGFAALLVSCAAWSEFALRGRHWALLAQQIAFAGTIVVGGWFWWLQPMLLGGAG